VVIANKNGKGPTPRDYNLVILWSEKFGGQSWNEFVGKKQKGTPFYIIGRLQDFISAQAEGQERARKAAENKPK
jgi:hypothetical protein